MKLLGLELVIQLAVLIAIGSSSGTVYITDLPIDSVLGQYSYCEALPQCRVQCPTAFGTSYLLSTWPQSLQSDLDTAPCAAEAVSCVVQGLTQEVYPQSVAALGSCACTQDQNSESIASNIASNAQEGCGNTASEDLASASSVFSAYCNQAAAVTLPTGGPVTEFIIDLPAFSELGRCAADAVSYAVQGLTENKCPGAVSLLLSSGGIRRLGMGAGTTSFPNPSYLSGDVTYYITDLPTYSSLATCAQLAVSYPVFELANNDCPTLPLGLVSCVCVKDQNSQATSSQIVSQISENCGKTASDDVNNALSVFAYYCSAGKGLVTPKGVTASVTTTPYRTGSGYTYSYGPTATNTGTGPLIQLPGTPSHIPLSAIIGGSVGAVIIVVFILVVVWRYRLHKHPAPILPPPQLHTENTYTNELLKAELPGASIANSLNKLIARKPTPIVAVSPVSPLGSESAVLTGRTEMEAQNRNEVPAGPNAQELHLDHTRYEVQGQPHAQESLSAPRYEAPWSNQHPVEVPGPPRANMNEGPFYELEGPYR